MGSIQPNPTHMGWVGLDLSDGVGLNFFDPPWWVGSKKLLTQPNPTQPMHTPTLSYVFMEMTPYQLANNTPLTLSPNFILPVNKRPNLLEVLPSASIPIID